MLVTNNIYQIKIKFDITEKIKRFVYVYLITGKYCYLIDSGVDGSEKQISAYMKKIGRDIKEIKAIFLTHSHPDHIGGAAAIKQITGCNIYASKEACRWSEDIDLQYKERPILNFYTLVNSSIKIDNIIENNQVIYLEPEISILPIFTPGHSHDLVSYLFQEKETIFIGDLIPTKNDLPIIVDYDASIFSLYKVLELKGVRWYCPAWDRSYHDIEIKAVITTGIKILQQLKQTVHELKNNQVDNNDLVSLVYQKLGIDESIYNPLFQRSILACYETK